MVYKHKNWLSSQKCLLLNHTYIILPIRAWYTNSKIENKLSHAFTFGIQEVEVFREKEE